ncbi:MAG: nucleotide exchange factor GrpE [Filomicrobium sp.]
MTDDTKKTGQNDNTPLSDADQPSKKTETPEIPGTAAFDSLQSDFEQEAGNMDPLDFADSPVDAVEMLQAQLETMEEQQAELAERLAEAQKEIHRNQAEIQNLHRRREKEIEEAGKYAITKFARDTVAVADNFERAISSVPEDALVDNPVLKSLLDGVTMTEREFLNVLERHGVQRISPKDELFDPHKHQAVMEQDDKAVPAGTVLQVYQAGYMIADRVLRPAMVVVAKGGPKPVKEQKEEEKPEEDVSAPDEANVQPDVEANASEESEAPKNGTEQT